ncbi:hypothetical protein CALCODRAFT_35717 [Calocera cornea HHB12733]|uniref:Uncharacterized protein n=1 Tax=Calocera cornea HHB12733 TaxID=1353952 RepID=A0A165E0Q0_9BASI|nr:hypothetical protein CALCODRAFT_35717 [Calocera cornea HHB12733]
MLAMLVLPFFRGYIMLPVALVSERYGELTLVILGEGIIGVIKTLGDAVKGFGVGNAVYGQAICVLVIICCAWHFLFHGFNPEIRMGKKRGILWLLLHLPLHSVLLLLLAGMRNAVQYVNLGNAVIDVTDAFATLQAQGIAVLSQNGSGAFDTSQLPMEHLTVQFGKLPITTSFPDEVAFFEATVQQFPGNATVDPFIELVQYEVDALYWIAAEYSVEPSQELTDAYVRITVGTNSSWTPSDNDTLVQDTFNASMDEVSQLVLDFLSLYTTEVLEGTVYFLPTSGGLLILVSILNLLRSAPIGRWMWITWASHLIVGIGLALLGLLDLGGIEIKLTNDNVGDNHLSPVYRLLHSNMMIPTAAIAYAVLVLADAVFLSIGRRAEGGSLNKVAAEEAYSPSANGVREDDVLPLVSIGQTKRSDSPPERDGSDDERSWDGYQKGTSGPSLRMYGKVASEEEGQGKN